MHPTLPERAARRARGVTLIEMVVAMVIAAIVLAATIYFAYPVRQGAELAVRAELTDIADNALQRMGRDVRLALPNSVRLTCGALCIEVIPVRTAGRYRSEPSGGGCSTTTDATGSDEIAFDVADTCFKSIGPVADAATIIGTLGNPANDFIVLNNTGQTSQDAYAGANRVQITLATAQTGPPDHERLNFNAYTFASELHTSPGKRFYVVTTPVSYICDLGTGKLTRWSGYAFGAAATSGTGADIASNVTGCSFDYAAAVAPQVGLLTLRLTLSKVASKLDAGAAVTETVSLFHAIHVSNVP